MALHNFLSMLNKLFTYCFNAPRRICDIVNVLDTTATFSNKFEVFSNKHFFKSKKYPKGMKLRFHLSLCNHEKKVKDVCSEILHKASTGIRVEIIKALEKEIRNLRTKRNNNRNNIKNKTTRENYKLIKKLVAEKVVTLEQKVKSRQVRKLSRDNIQPTTSVRKRNRRFKKDVIVNKRKQKRKRYRSKKKQSIK